jgi:hypothetical protein
MLGPSPFGLWADKSLDAIALAEDNGDKVLRERKFHQNRSKTFLFLVTKTTAPNRLATGAGRFLPSLGCRRDVTKTAYAQ